MGYRWFDAQHTEPLFSFGHGLSYTSFAYSDIKVHRNGDGSADVTFKIKNTGDVAGDEVPQLYLDAPREQVAGVDYAPRTLAGFDRVTLQAGESKVVNLHVSSRAFQYWSPIEHAWRTPGGRRRVHVGASSRDLRLEALL